ncbi:CoA ester lyase [Natronomonas salina]|uniref:HpcH/HpaI aldolase/citrate lyase family protein n=1 Tax=Natronomonas salina TaxID=1710540 RepID=UPI0015B58194|nr:CoA ester lyase [Natronomonas salina]QLD88231.1 CoA ester lyase [Natronomonas salina]
MPRRSVLFSPGDQPALMQKAPGAGVDTVVFDLEDAVAPGRKDEARQAVNDVLTDPGFDPDCEVCVRVNPDPRVADDDLEAVLAGEPRIDSVMVPKASSAADVREKDELVRDHGYDLPVLALCESAQGVLHAEEIAATPAVDAVAFGAEDLSADIGATRTESGEEVSHARQHVVLAAGAADVDAIDTVFTDVEDTDRLAEETAFATQLGYDGKMAIHPAQVPVINEAFTPAEEDVEWAEKVLAARDEADDEGRGVFRVDDEMIDAPLIARAERIVERYRAADE